MQPHHTSSRYSAMTATLTSLLGLVAYLSMFGSSAAFSVGSMEFGCSDCYTQVTQIRKGPSDVRVISRTPCFSFMPYCKVHAYGPVNISMCTKYPSPECKISITTPSSLIETSTQSTLPPPESSTAPPPEPPSVPPSEYTTAPPKTSSNEPPTESSTASPTEFSTGTPTSAPYSESSTTTHSDYSSEPATEPSATPPTDSSTEAPAPKVFENST